LVGCENTVGRYYEFETVDGVRWIVSFQQNGPFRYEEYSNGIISSAYHWSSLNCWDLDEYERDIIKFSSEYIVSKLRIWGPYFGGKKWNDLYWNKVQTHISELIEVLKEKHK
jgi:hypothetical protein